MTRYANQNKFVTANEKAKEQYNKNAKRKILAMPLILKDEEPVEVVLLDKTSNDPYVSAQHRIKVYKNGRETWETVRCIEGLGLGECPLCQEAGDGKGRVTRASVVVSMTAIDPRPKSYVNKNGKTVNLPFQRVLVNLTAQAQRDVFARFYEKHGKKNNNKMRGLLVEFKRGEKKQGALGLPVIENSFLSEEEIVERFGTPERVSEKDPSIVYAKQNMYIEPFNYDEVLPVLKPDEIRAMYNLKSPFGSNKVEDEDENDMIEDDEVPQYKEDIPFDSDEEDEIPF